MVVHWQQSGDLDSAALAGCLLKACVQSMTEGVSSYAKTATAALLTGQPQRQQGTEYDREAIGLIATRVLAGEAVSLEKEAENILGEKARLPASTRAAEAGVLNL